MKRLGYIFLSLAALALAGCKGDGNALKEGKLEYTPEVNVVEVMTLKRTDFPKQILSNGKLMASSRAVLKFGTSGPVKTLNVKNGQRVRAGQVIADRLTADAQRFPDLSQREVLIIAHIKAVSLLVRKHTAVIVRQQRRLQRGHGNLLVSRLFP